VEQKKNPIDFVGKVIAFKRKIDDLTNNVFSKNPKFEKHRNQGFQNFLNKFQRTPVFLAMYSDKMLKKGLKNNNEQEREEKIKELTQIIFFLFQKDIFFKRYVMFLAKRLLNENSLSDECERLLIVELKKECG
jgi:hypothetical protein